MLFHRDDDGFSLIEVMFASFLAFVILTATFGLVVASSKQGKVARKDSVATTLGNQLIEQARLVKYAQLGTPGGNPSGTLVSTEETTFMGIVFTVTRQVTWADDPTNGIGSPNDMDFKKLTLSVSWPQGKTLVFETYVRDRSNEDPVPPSVQWVASSIPPQDAVIFDQSSAGQASIWHPGTDPYASDGLAYLHASATATGDAGVITRFEYWVDGRVLYNSQMAPPEDWAVWKPNQMSYEKQYPIYSKSLDASGVPILPDGKRAFKVEVWTAAGSRDYKTLYLTVDNYAPTFASTVLTWTVPPGNKNRHDVRMDTTWSQAMDGTDPAAVYFRLRTNGGNAVYYALSPGLTSLALGAASTPALKGMTAYRFRIEARSPRGLPTGTESRPTGSGVFYVTAPTLDGTMSKNGSKCDLALAISPPSTSLLGYYSANSVVYTLYEQDSYTAGSNLSAAKTGYVGKAVTMPWDGKLSLTGLTPGKYYQVSVTLKDGAGLVRVGPLYSNVIGPTAASNGAAPIPVN